MNWKQKLQLYGIVKLFGYIVGAIGMLFKMIYSLLKSFWNTPPEVNPIVKPDVPVPVDPNKPKRPVIDALRKLFRKKMRFNPAPGILVVTKTGKKRTIGSVTIHVCQIVDTHFDDSNNFPADSLIEVRHDDLKPLYKQPENIPSDGFLVDAMNVDGYYTEAEHE